jgi:hypothetical protein
MADEDGGTCRVCVFCAPINQVFGECRRHAPRPTERMSSEDRASSLRARWLIVETDDWCGEFRDKEGAA